MVTNDSGHNGTVPISTVEIFCLLFLDMPSVSRFAIRCWCCGIEENYHQETCELLHCIFQRETGLLCQAEPSSLQRSGVKACKYKHVYSVTTNAFEPSWMSNYPRWLFTNLPPPYFLGECSNTKCDYCSNSFTVLFLHVVLCNFSLAKPGKKWHLRNRRNTGTRRKKSRTSTMKDWYVIFLSHFLCIAFTEVIIPEESKCYVCSLPE